MEEYSSSSWREYMKVGKCEGEKEVDGEMMPLVLQPADGNKKNKDLKSLVMALRNNKEWFEQSLRKKSAILVRGFEVKNAEEFNEIIEEAFGWEDMRYVGPAPRTHVYNRIWTANEGPLSHFVYFHHEMVLMKEYPEKVILFCEIPPPEGGETPIVPSFRVTERMVEEFGEEVIKEMEDKGLKYSFIAPSSNDTSSMRGRGWQDAFGTSDPKLAQIRAKGLGMELEWDVVENGGVRVVIGGRGLTKVFEGRKLGRRMWFNTVVGMHGKEHSSVTMGDGSEIPKEFVKRCEEIIEEESIQFKWQKGDLLFLDNLALLHARRPSLPPRRVLVATCK